MKVNPSIFKSYDIRGIFPSEIDEESAEQIGKLFIDCTGAKKVVVGRDMRLSSPLLFAPLVKGITEQGADVYDMGQVPTECLYFAVGKYDYDAGIIITASHNPKEYNGFKMIKKDIDEFSMIRGKDLLGFFSKNQVTKTNKKGRLENIGILEEYLDYVFSKINAANLKPFKVVIDAGNGMAGKVIPLIEKRLPIEIVSLNFKLDGNFPAHPSNPLEKGVTNQVQEAVKKEKADFGLIFDGDADRIFLIDDLGNFIQGDITLLLLANHILKEKPGAVIAYNTICSKAVPELIKKWGGKPIRTPVGFVNVREALIKNKGLMGGELSGHYCFKDNFYGDSSVIAFLILLNFLSQSNKKVSEIITDFSPYVKSSEINFEFEFEVEDRESVLTKIKEKHKDAKQDYLDGVTVEYDDWWFNIRPSNTEPLLRLIIEAKTKELLEKKKKELSALIENLK